jgi:hypothetical protein
MFSKFGVRSVPFQVTQAAYAITLFESVNYIEHYGLKRERKPMVNMSVLYLSIVGTITM